MDSYLFALTSQTVNNPGNFELAPCALKRPSGNFNPVPNAVPLFQPQMASDLSSAFNNLNQQGIIPMITSGFRTPADQARMRQGASGPNPAAVFSWHEVGMAVDFNTQDGNFNTIK